MRMLRESRNSSKFDTRAMLSMPCRVACCALGCAVALCALPGCAAPKSQSANPATAASGSSKFSDWYPASITMPEGLQYPCALTALPKSLSGIPNNEREYVNHVYSMILQCVQAKTRMYKELGNPTGARAAYSKYYYQVQPALEKIKKEKTPAGLEKFRDDVISAVTLQCTFFDKAAKMAEARKSWNEIIGLPEGRQASGLLIDAFNQMQSRYPSWSADTKDSIYHHLCALDLF